MKIGIFTDTYPPFTNGVATSIYVLEKALEKKGHDVFIVTVNTEKMAYNLKDRLLKVPGIPLGVYDYRLAGIYPLMIIKRIKKWNLDVIHSHSIMSVGLFSRIIAKQFNIPLVHTYHTMYEDYTHYISKGIFSKTTKKLVKPVTDFYCDKTVTELVVPTKKAYDLFKEKYQYQRNIHIVPTGIPLDKYYNEKYPKEDVQKLQKRLGIEENDFVILFVGRLAKEKNVDFLIDNHKALVKKNKKAKLLLVGDGPLTEKLKEKVKKLKLENNIIFAGRVDYQEIGYYYQAATVFATASTSETQGLTVFEALAASLPIVVINDESFKTAVEDKYNGFVFKNKKEYQKIMLDLIDNQVEIKTLKIQARTSSEKHSDRYFAERMLVVYKVAVSKRKIKRETWFRKTKRRLLMLWKK